jgi:hypothetical protein
LRAKALSAAGLCGCLSAKRYPSFIGTALKDEEDENLPFVNDRPNQDQSEKEEKKMTTRIPTLAAFMPAAGEGHTPQRLNTRGAAILSLRVVQALWWLIVFVL